MAPAPVSSIKTSRAGSSRPCSWIHLRRARAIVPALLFRGAQAFFLAGDVMTTQETTQRAPAGANALLAQRRQNFFQGGVRPFVDDRQYLLLVLLQPRGAPAARLCRRTAGIAQPLQPFDRRTHRDIEKLRRPRDATTLRKRLRSIALANYSNRPSASLTLPQTEINADRLAYPNALRIPFRFKSTGNRSRYA